LAIFWVVAMPTKEPIKVVKTVKVVFKETMFQANDELLGKIIKTIASPCWTKTGSAS